MSIPGGNTSVSTDSSGDLALLRVTADGGLAVNTGDAVSVSTPFTPGGNVAIAVNPSGDLAFIALDSQGRVIVAP